TLIRSCTHNPSVGGPKKTRNCRPLPLLRALAGCTTGLMLFSGRLAWRDRMARSARIALVAALLFGGTSLATAKTRGAAHRNPSPPRITETAPRQQQCGNCDLYGHSITAY